MHVARRPLNARRAPASRSSAEPFLPHALVATFAVIVAPALAVSSMQTSDRPWLLLTSMLLAMALSVAAASLGAAIWSRRADSRDIVFADLMLWGWLRRVRAERRLAEAQGLLGSEAHELDDEQLSRERRCKILQRLAAMLEAKDGYTLGHSRRVTRHAERIARDMGLSSEDVARVRIAASIHDVGKVHTPRHILTKPDKLTAEEIAVMQRHPVDGAEMAAEIGDPEITAMVRHHHERLDGSGYPDGLRRDRIPIGARIIAVADTFDAITSSRAYQGARNHRQALEIVAEEAGWRLDPEAVAAFLNYYSGRRAVLWSALGFAGAPRLAGLAGGPLSGVGASAPPLLQSFAAVVAAAVAGAALGGEPQSATAASERAAAGGDRAVEQRGVAPGDSARRDSRRRVGGGPGGRVAPVGGRRGDGLRGGAPQGGTGGGPTPPGNANPGDSTSPPPVVETPPVRVPPDDEVPGVEVEVPGVELPDLELPNVEVPDLSLPDVTLPDRLLPDVALPQVDLPQIGLPVEVGRAD